MSGEISLQEVPEDDDMACGDLGNGFDRRHSDTYKLEGLSISTNRSRRNSAQKSPSSFMLLSKGEVCDATVFRCSRCNSLNDTLVKKMGIMNGSPSCSRQNSFDGNSEVSYDELRQQLQEAVEEVEILRVELEASQRQLEGKEQALKILQSMAMLNKATSHTKALCKKTEQQKRVLEKEINILQWELKVNQEKFKNKEDSWAEKYDRLYCENAAFKETLKMKTEEVKTLKSENEFLERQYLEILAMLDVKQQKIFQEIKSLSKSGVTEITGVELAVLGACTCSGPENNPCSCAKMLAATRKQLLQLKQESELLKKSKEEAFVMADAFRIAFEQQLMRRKDHALRLAQMSKICQRDKKLLTWKSGREDGSFRFQGNGKSLGKKLMSRLASGLDSKKIEELSNPEEVIRMLIDLLNDNEEALAHQRKVSYMLARALEEKENSLQPNKDNKCSEEEFVSSSTQCRNNSETQEEAIPVCSDSKTCPAQEGSCSFSKLCLNRMPDCSPEVLTSLTSEGNNLHKTEETDDTKLK